MKALGVSLVAFFLLAAAVSSAAELSLDVSPQDITVSAGEEAALTATLTTDAKSGGVYLYVTGGPSSWINIGSSYIRLPSRTVSVPLAFYPNDVPGVYTYTILAQSDAFPGLSDEKDVNLVILGPSNINLVEGSVEKSGDFAKVHMVLKAEEKESAVIEFSLTDKAGKTAATYTYTEQVEGTKDVSLSIPLSSIVAGDYSAKAVVKGTAIAVTGKVRVDPVHLLVKTQEEENGALYNEYRIGVANEGNVVEEGYVIEADVPTGFITFSTPPEKCADGVCEWAVPPIKPSGDFKIAYRVEYWPLVAEGLLIAVLVSAFVVFGWNRMNMPFISKRVEGGKGGSYTAIIEIRNAGRNITNVKIKDFVTPLFQVEGASFETLKPEMRHSAEGTELVWSLDTVGPGEHRIIHYKMKPVINGHLRVSKASMKYTFSNGVRGKIKSRESFVAA